MTTALTIAGSDPSGGAGIQSDLKTFSRLRVYGMAVIAAMTAQNTRGVSSVAEVSPDFVAEQLDSIFADIRVDSVKTGMLLTEGVIEAVAAKLKEHSARRIVVDPVMISTSGAPLLQETAIPTFRRTLLPLALVVTPNLDEARTLSGVNARTTAEMEDAARRVHDLGPRYVLIKGGHLDAPDATDVLFDGHTFEHLRSSRVDNPNVHGTGCVLSAAIAAFLALGRSPGDAVQIAKEFVTTSIRHAVEIGGGAKVSNPSFEEH